MDFTMLADFINQSGFPIAMCCALLWYLNRSDEKREEQNNALVRAINELTLYIKGGHDGQG